jgi:hypothetical protein
MKFLQRIVGEWDPWAVADPAIQTLRVLEGHHLQTVGFREVDGVTVEGQKAMESEPSEIDR